MLSKFEEIKVHHKPYYIDKITKWIFFRLSYWETENISVFFRLRSVFAGYCYQLRIFKEFGLMTWILILGRT